MNADDTITINHVDTTRFAAVVNVLFQVVAVLERESQNETNKEILHGLRDVLNKVF